MLSNSGRERIRNRGTFFRSIRASLLLWPFLLPCLYAAEPTTGQIKNAKEFVYEGVGWKSAESASAENFLKLYPKDEYTKDLQRRRAGQGGRLHFEVRLNQNAGEGLHQLVAEYEDEKLSLLAITDWRRGRGLVTYATFVELFGKPFHAKQVNINLTHYYWKLDNIKIQFELYYGLNQFGNNTIEDGYRVILVDSIGLGEKRSLPGSAGAKQD